MDYTPHPYNNYQGFKPSYQYKKKNYLVKLKLWGTIIII